MTNTIKSLLVSALLVLILITPASGKDSIAPNTSRHIAGEISKEQILNVDLITDNTTRVQIITTKQDEIIQNHRLITGPEGVIDGKHKGAVQWCIELPPKTKASEFEVVILVQGFAGDGSAVSYDVNPLQAGSNSGFCFADCLK